MQELIDHALAEDLGTGDVTSEAVVPADALARARIDQKAEGVIAGLQVAEAVFRRVDPELRWHARVEEGVWREGGLVAEVAGPARSMLAGERVALNFLGRLSGVATLTARYVRAVEGTGARILDTRKTTPGLRTLEKQAVAAGGGAQPPRRPLRRDAAQGEPLGARPAGVGEATRRRWPRRRRACRWRWSAPRSPRWTRRWPPAPRSILLDNMSLDELREAVAHTRGTGRDRGVGRRHAGHGAGDRRDGRGLDQRRRADALGSGAGREPADGTALDRAEKPQATRLQGSSNSSRQCELHFDT